MDLEDIKWWIEDHYKTLLGMVIVISIVVISFFVIKTEREQDRTIPKGYDGQIQLLKENEEQIKGHFSKLGEFETELHEGEVIYNIELFNKKPFSTKQEIENTLRKYIEGLEIITNTKGKTVRGVKLTLYDRKIKHEQGIRPDGVYYYGIPYEKLPDSEKDSSNTRYLQMSPDEAAFEYTSTVAPKGIDTDEHKLYGSYRQLERRPDVNPMTDQEYEWYVKLEHYTMLGSEWGTLYLEWELGAPKRTDASRLFSRDVAKFKKRVTDIGGYPTIFGNDSIRERDVYRRLVIDNPSFLWFVETEEVVEDAIEARSKLVKKYPNKYRDVVEEWVESLAEEQIQKMEQGIDPAQDSQNNTEEDISEEVEGDLVEPEEDIEGELDEPEEIEESEEGTGNTSDSKKPVF